MPMQSVTAMEEKSRYYPDYLNLWELPESCPDCTEPLHMASGQDIAFCPNCAIDKQNAVKGRHVLMNLRERCMQEEAQKILKRQRGELDDQLRGPFKFGMPL